MDSERCDDDSTAAENIGVVNSTNVPSPPQQQQHQANGPDVVVSVHNHDPSSLLTLQQQQQQSTIVLESDNASSNNSDAVGTNHDTHVQDMQQSKDESVLQPSTKSNCSENQSMTTTVSVAISSTITNSEDGDDSRSQINNTAGLTDLTQVKRAIAQARAANNTPNKNNCGHTIASTTETSSVPTDIKAGFIPSLPTNNTRSNSAVTLQAPTQHRPRVEWVNPSPSMSATDDQTSTTPTPLTMATAQAVEENDNEFQQRHNDRDRIIQEARDAFVAEATPAEPIDINDEHKKQQRRRRRYTCAGILFIVVLASTLGATIPRSRMRKSSTTLTAPSVITLAPTETPTASPVVQLDDGRIAFTTRDQLIAAVDIYVNALRNNGGQDLEALNISARYGFPIGTWDVSRLTDFNRVFDPARNEALSSDRKPSTTSPFDDDLSGWDVSKATTLHGMFAAANEFTGRGLENWDVGRVTDFSHMFARATKFNGDITAWNTSSAIQMNAMLFYCTNFSSGNLSRWDVSKVTTMESMFAWATKFRGDLRLWNVSNVVNMKMLFANTLSNHFFVSTWDTSKVTTMNKMVRT